MNSIAFIFARKGSKRIKNKNMKIINGKPLIDYTLKFIKKIKFIDTIVVSTDDEKIINYCKKKKIKNTIIIKRPKFLTSDNSDEFLSWKHAIKKINYLNNKFKTFIFFPLTSPLRLKSEFVSAFKTFNKKKPDMTVSICKTNHYPNFNIVTQKKNKSIKLTNNKSISKSIRNKTFNVTTAFYIADKKYVMKNKKINFSKDNIIGHVVSRKSGIDIDDKFDLEVAKLFISKRKN